MNQLIKEWTKGKMALIVQDKNGDYFIFGIKNGDRKRKIKRLYGIDERGFF